MFETIRYMVKIFEKFPFLRKYRKFLISSHFQKISILVKISKIPAFGQNFRKISILVKFSKQYDFGQNFRKISILV